MRAWIAGPAVLAPGLPGWAEAAPVLAGNAPWQETAFTLPPPALLPATERRRTSAAVRLALAVAQAATAASGLAAEGLASVFASSCGDGHVVGSILEAMTTPGGAVSPTQFHNSVHNAAAGYWTIAAGSQRPSVSLAADQGSFAAGLLQAAALAGCEGQPVLLCAYDTPLPAPLAAHRPVRLPFAVAMVVAPVPLAGSQAGLQLSLAPGPAAAAPLPGLEALQGANPQAVALPLLRALALGGPAELALPLDAAQHLRVVMTPC